MGKWVDEGQYAMYFFAGLETLNKMDSPDSFEHGNAGCSLSLSDGTDPVLSSLLH